ALYLVVSIEPDVVSMMPSVKQVLNRSVPLPQNHVSFADVMVLAEKERGSFAGTKRSDCLGEQHSQVLRRSNASDSWHHFLLH
ncbi:MAG: hypothetical protein ACKPKO_44460, partial [Candidatus Fonsibacter sp.]